MTKKISFNKRTLLALKPPAEGRVYYYDSGQANLALCITANGARTFYRYGRVEGRPERIRIGCFPDIAIEQARKQTREMAGDIARGERPKLKRDKRGTVEELFDHWLAKAKMTRKTWQADQNSFNFHFGPIRHRRFATLATADIARWHTAIGTTRGKVIANRCRALLCTIYSKAAHELGYHGPNPCLKVERFPETSRERFLQFDEMRPFFIAVKAEPAEWRDFWLLCLFTGARRGNVASMAWADIDLRQGVWLVKGAESKNGQPLGIVLVPPAVNILKARADGRGDSPWVFPASGATGHVVDPRKSWARILDAAGIDGINPHDLRRSLGSWQAQQGTSLQIVGKSLGHSDSRSTEVYSRLQLAPVRDSVASAVAAMQAAGEPHEPKKPRTKKAK